VDDAVAGLADDPADAVADETANSAVDEAADVRRAAVGERELVAAGARVPAGSARAAARASAARAAVTAGKGHATRPRDQGEKRGNLAQRVMRYLREVAGELRKVIWPTRNEMVTYSIVVIIFLVFMIAVTWGADFGFARLILAIFG
jgi:preprotein translocase subunit SecE